MSSTVEAILLLSSNINLHRIKCDEFIIDAQ